MRIVLIEIEEHGPLFLAEPPPSEADEDAATRPGLRGWFARKRIKLLGDLERSTGFVGKTLGGIWSRLQRLISPDEYLLRELRTAESITLEHPACLAQPDVSAAWQTFLASRWAKHGKWLIVDGVFAPISIVLGPLPGPNIVCYWLFYRAVVHFLARRGAGRARRGELPTTLQPRIELDGTIKSGDDGHIRNLAEALSFPDFPEILLRMLPERLDPDAGEPQS